jgi:hypothetical protein
MAKIKMGRLFEHLLKNLFLEQNKKLFIFGTI